MVFLFDWVLLGVLGGVLVDGSGASAQDCATATSPPPPHTHLRGGEAREQARLQVLEADRVAVELGHQGGLRVLQVGALVADDEREQLVLQALFLELVVFMCVLCVWWFVFGVDDEKQPKPSDPKTTATMQFQKNNARAR